jgi:anti-sigma regulatory factor (Ser/Thr protein kinase)
VAQTEGTGEPCPSEAQAADDPDTWTLSTELGPGALRSIDVVQLFARLFEHVPSFAEQRSRLYTVFSELYSNALEHGLLGLRSWRKESADGFAAYYNERERALAQLNRGSIKIDIDYRRKGDDHVLMLAVADSGPGFVPQKSAAEAPDLKSGRGISLVRSLCRDVRYNEDGNRVVATYVWSDTSSKFQVPS